MLKKLLKKVKENIKDIDREIVVGIGYGPSSVFLAYALSELSIDFRAVHVDFGIECYGIPLLEERGIKVEKIKPCLEISLKDAEKYGMELVPELIEYGAISTLIKEYDCIAVAYTAEEIFFKFIEYLYRGRALLSRSLRPVLEIQGKKRILPLWNIQRKEIESVIQLENVNPFGNRMLYRRLQRIMGDYRQIDQHFYKQAVANIFRITTSLEPLSEFPEIEYIKEIEEKILKRKRESEKEIKEAWERVKKRRLPPDKRWMLRRGPKYISN